MRHVAPPNKSESLPRAFHTWTAQSRLQYSHRKFQITALSSREHSDGNGKPPRGRIFREISNAILALIVWMRLRAVVELKTFRKADLHTGNFTRDATGNYRFDEITEALIGVQVLHCEIVEAPLVPMN